MGRSLLVCVLVLAMAAAAGAGGNPYVRCYIDFDPPNMVHWVQPEPGTTVDAYICLSELEMGMTVLSFRVTDIMTEYPGVFSSCSFQSLLPGGLAIGDPFEGITVASTECMPPPHVCVGVLHLEYAEGDACIEIMDHPEYPRWVFDCNDPGEVDDYLTTGHGTVGGVTLWCPPGAFDSDVRCEPQGSGNPVHPPAYWYDCHPHVYSWSPYFRIRVYDSDPGNYKNWIEPLGWTHEIIQEGDETYVHWTELYAENRGRDLVYRFGFENDSDAIWGDWYYDSTSSLEHSWMPNGYGYRVHVPGPSTGVDPIAEESSWSVIKALYR